MQLELSFQSCAAEVCEMQVLLCCAVLCGCRAVACLSSLYIPYVQDTCCSTSAFALARGAANGVVARLVPEQTRARVLGCELPKVRHRPHRVDARCGSRRRPCRRPRDRQRESLLRVSNRIQLPALHRAQGTGHRAQGTGHRQRHFRRCYVWERAAGRSAHDAVSPWPASARRALALPATCPRRWRPRH
jgi:hypothetical protein